LITFSCIIIDDEPLALTLLTRCIDKVPNLSLIKAYSDPILASREIKALNKPVDFIFTDVEMPNLNGLTLADEIAHKATNIVLVSAHILYSIEGYNVNAKHFLYKPYTLEKMEKIVNGIINNMAKKKPYILIRLGGKLQIEKIYVDEIIAIQGNGNYINIHTINATLVSYYKLSDMENDLKLFSFMKRISKSYIISTNHIEKIKGFSIFLKNNLTVSVGESYRSDFKKNITKLFD
jgi:DNA-binding LytR/AlgR family response regulator